jgi:hypothetical protein
MFASHVGIALMILAKVFFFSIIVKNLVVILQLEETD